jgi:hypothetical protein
LWPEIASRSTCAASTFDRHLAHRLRRVDREQRALRLDQRPISAIGWSVPISLFAHITDTTVVRSSIARELREVDEPVRAHRHHGDAEALLLEHVHDVEHRLVLGRERDDAVALVAVLPRRALEHQVVRLGRARGEHDLRGWAPIACATCARAVSTACSARQPKTWFRLAALP